MSIRWERFSGNTSQFALKMSLHDDPHPLRGADADMSASWGALQIWIDGVNICAHTDQGELLTAAHWYLLPLLEWIAESWDPLLHEERLPVSKKATGSSIVSDQGVATIDEADYWETEERLYRWEQRHALRSAAEGGLFPDLRLRRLRDKVEFSWAKTPLPGALDVDWQAPAGLSYVDPETVAKVIFDVALAAAQELATLRPDSARVMSLVSSINSLNATERSETRTAWLAGLGQNMDSAISRWRSLIRDVSSRAGVAAFKSSFQNVAENALVVRGSCQAALLFGSVSPAISEADALTLATKLIEAYSVDGAPLLHAHATQEPLDDTAAPWAQGYDLAEDLLEDAFFGPSTPSPDIEAFIDRLGIHVQSIALSDNEVRAVSFSSPTHRATILLNSAWAGNDSLGGKRFTLAHELCHLLFDESYGAQLAVASGPWAPLALEQRANAFAAMLLMPPGTLREIDRVTPFSTMSRAELRNAAKEIRVTPSALTEHLYNMRLINEAERESLR